MVNTILKHKDKDQVESFCGLNELKGKRFRSLHSLNLKLCSLEKKCKLPYGGLSYKGNYYQGYNSISISISNIEFNVYFDMDGFLFVDLEGKKF